jgi:hypothetical protein
MILEKRRGTSIEPYLRSPWRRGYITWKHFHISRLGPGGRQDTLENVQRYAGIKNMDG